MSKNNGKTNWDLYYSKTYKITSYTRKTTENLLLKLIKKFSKNYSDLKIAELGGANSCFYDAIKDKISPLLFHVVDNNQIGIDRFKQRIENKSNVSFENADVLNYNLYEEKFDLVFSIGLIEHFNSENTAKAIKTHFDILKKGGIAIISFPTPTILYIIVRKICEIIGIWFFHDERPLKFDEVINEVKKYGKVEFKKINWKVILTQGFVVVKKSQY